MGRVTVSVQTRARRKKVLKLAKGFTGGRKTLFKNAKETLQRAMVFNYRDRKVKKRNMRGLWITRISIASKENGLNYSQLMNGLLKSDIRLNRKILADLAVKDKETFKKLIEAAKESA
ncbi:MAG: 50S ribosomal protein L20 [Candidatus Aureabacteria bacterium]|nr:50S ribosomal protein L20 [Candidatus Auribacterota bacterium]